MPCLSKSRSPRCGPSPSGSRYELAANPPSTAAAPASLLILEMMNRDLHPFLSRWRPRLAAWRQASRPEQDWPLRELCCSDLERTRARLTARSWQLGEILALPDLDRLLPERAATIPALAAAEDLAAAEAAATTLPAPESLRAAWHIYIEAMSRLPSPALAPGGGRLGEAIASLDALADEARANLKTLPPGRSGRDGDTIEGLLLRLLHEGLTPFLAEWQPRHARFQQTARPESKWRRAEACRVALAATRARCLPIVRALGRQINAPILADMPLQLPAPLPASTPATDPC